MSGKNLFQKIAIFLIILIFGNECVGSESQGIRSGGTISYDAFLDAVTKEYKVDKQKLTDLGPIFDRYGLAFYEYIIPNKDLNACHLLYIKKLFADTAKNIYFTDPFFVMSDFCDFEMYIKSRRCAGSLLDFEFFLNKEFLDKIYAADTRETTIGEKENKRQLQGFVENIMALFFLLPQPNRCSNRICTQRGCTERDDINLYKAYGALRMYAFFYKFSKGFVIGIQTGSEREYERIKNLGKFTSDLRSKLVDFVQHALNTNQREIFMRELNKRLLLDLKRLIPSASDRDVLKEGLINEIKGEAKPVQEGRKPALYQQYFQKFRSFFGGQEMTPSE